MGKSIGGTLGLPAEGKMERLNFTFYNPVPTSAPANDDLELQLVWLDLVERVGASLTATDFAEAWLNNIHYMWDEYGRCRWNLRRGVPLENIGTFENPFHAGMGSPIRSEIWACLFPGDPDSAAHYAAMDASLDHGNEGIAGEVFFAVVQSLAASGVTPPQAVARALTYLPAQMETTAALQLVQTRFESGMSAWDCWREVIEAHANENFTHAPLNVALTVWALLYGENNFERSILLAANAGYDTDCTAATVGATLGLAFGKEGIPAMWSDPIGDGISVGPGIRGISAPETLTELTERILAVASLLKPKSWDNSIWTQAPPPISPDQFPGTIQMKAPGVSVPWANGELPIAIKQAGVGQWEWSVAGEERRQIVCLAREGATLFIDGRVALDCPPGLPFVPAPHRVSPQSTIEVNLPPGRHDLRVELKSHSPEQDVCVLLTYPNHHLCPWTPHELEKMAILPSSAKQEAISPRLA
jgi:ADP-ribosylglycohydrolase